MEGFSFRTAVRESNKVRGSRSWLRFVRSSKAPELPVILLEDFGALIGLILALLGVGLMLLTGNPIFDVLGSGSIGVLLVVIAAFLAVEMKSLLVGESATPAHQKAILDALASPDAVQRVIHSKTLHIGPEELLVAAKLAVAPTERADDVAAAIDEAERRARDAVPELTLVMYLEPDVDRGDAYVPAERPRLRHPPATDRGTSAVRMPRVGVRGSRSRMECRLSPARHWRPLPGRSPVLRDPTRRAATGCG